MASALTVLAVAMVVTLIVLRSQAQAIRLSQAHAAQTAAMMFEVVEGEDPYRDSKQRPTRSLIRLAEAQLAQSGNAPLLRADLHDALGKAHYYQGTHRQARVHLEKALALRLAHGADLGADSARTYYHLGLSAMAEQQWQAAEGHFLQALKRLAAAPGRRYPTKIRVQHKRIALMMQQGQWDAAQALVETLDSEPLGRDTQLGELKLIIEAESFAAGGKLREAESTFGRSAACKGNGYLPAIPCSVPR